MAEKLAPEKRHAFMHGEKKVFEWEQTLEEVNIYIELPNGVPKKLFYCSLSTSHIEVGIRGNSPPYLNHDLHGPIKTGDSFWTLEDGTMHVTLQKRDRGKTWASPILGKGGLDPYSADIEQKRLMLQRFQEEELSKGVNLAEEEVEGHVASCREKGHPNKHDLFVPAWRLQCLSSCNWLVLKSVWKAKVPKNKDLHLTLEKRMTTSALFVVL